MPTARLRSRASFFMMVSRQSADESHRLPESSPARHQTLLNTCAPCRRLYGCAWFPFLSAMVDAVRRQISVRSSIPSWSAASVCAWPCMTINRQETCRRPVVRPLTVQPSLRCSRPLSPSACRQTQTTLLRLGERGRREKSLVSAKGTSSGRIAWTGEGVSRSSHPAAPPDVLSLQCSQRLQRQLDKYRGHSPSVGKPEDGD